MTSKRQKKRKRKESRELAVKLAKAAARANLGTPPPTRVRMYRKGGGGRKFKENIEHKEEFLNIYEPPEEQSAVYVSSLRLRPYVATQKKGFRNIMSNVPVIGYSKEILLHANFLRETQGEKAMSDYLTDQKKEPQSSQSIMGPIEAALKDAETKHKYFSGQIAIVQAEANRWEQVAAGLRRTLELATGKTVSARVNGERSQTGKWREWILLTLDTPEKSPISRKEIRKGAYQAFPDAQRNSVDVAINSNLKKIIEEGIAFQQEDKIYLAKWTEPESREPVQQEEVA